MNEELQNTLNSFVIDMIGAFEQTGEWIAGEIPLLIKEIVLWNVWYNLTLFIAGILLIPVLVYVLFASIQKKYQWQKELWKLTEGAHIVATAFVVMLGSGAAYNMINLTWLKAWIAPRLFLLEYAQGLVG